MEIIKQELHPENEPNKVIYPKTSTDQVEGLNNELTPYQKKTDLDNDVSALGFVKGNNLKTVNGENIVGSGNVNMKMYMQEIVVYSESTNSYINLYILTSSNVPLNTLAKLYAYIDSYNYVVPLLANSSVLRPKGKEKRVPIYIMYTIGADIRIGYYDDFGVTDHISIVAGSILYDIRSCAVIEL